MARKKKSDIIDYAQQPQVPQALVEELPMGKVVEDAYIRFGSYVNTSRHFLGLKDGLKPSYRRLYYISSTFKKGEWIPNNTLLGSVSRIHPHGVDSLLGVVSVFAISGVFDFKGSPGHTNLLGQTSEPAAARYTKSKISDLYLRIMGGTLSEVNMIPSPNEEKEPEYIPTPIPLGMILNERSLGLGVGISTNVPTFDPKSLLNAYLNNDPQLLEPRTDIIIDKSKSDLQKLWETGQGNIHYKLKVGRVVTPDNREGILIGGDSLIFTPDWNKRIKKWEAENKLTIDDCTDITGPKVLIARIPGARNLTIDEIEKECLRICQKSIKFTIYATDGSSTFRIPIKNWIDYT
jgi:DNA gyrase/topoisomerase IV subunit A